MATVCGRALTRARVTTPVPAAISSKSVGPISRTRSVSRFAYGSNRSGTRRNGPVKHDGVLFQSRFSLRRQRPLQFAGQSPVGRKVKMDNASVIAAAASSPEGRGWRSRRRPGGTAGRIRIPDGKCRHRCQKGDDIPRLCGWIPEGQRQQLEEPKASAAVVQHAGDLRLSAPRGHAG
jgi:hypothetical protein